MANDESTPLTTEKVEIPRAILDAVLTALPIQLIYYKNEVNVSDSLGFFAASSKMAHKIFNF